MYYIAVCDDERLFAEKLKQWILEYFAEMGSACQVDVYDAGEDLIRNLSLPLRYQIIFLDINMKQLDGIETANVLREYSETAVLIFVTAFIQYTIEGYKVEALRYILKDDIHIRLMIKEALDAACKKIDRKDFTVRIPFSDGVSAIEKRRIVYIECVRHKVVFYIKTEDGMTQREMRATMNEAFQYMDENAVRIHQSFAVNLTYCKKVYYDHVILMDGMGFLFPEHMRRRQRKNFIIIKEYFDDLLYTKLRNYSHRNCLYASIF